MTVKLFPEVSLSNSSRKRNKANFVLGPLCSLIKNKKQTAICTFFVVKVIPLKLFYHQTFFKLGVIEIHDTNIKKM